MSNSSLSSPPRSDDRPVEAPDEGRRDSRVDGRSARARKTRDAIVDACISLVEEGELRPTAPRVAERAGVSVRSVFQHFDDLPSLHIAVTERVSERVGALVHPVDPALPLDERIETFVRYRGVLLEAMTPFRRAANVHGPFSAEIRQALRRSTEYLREEVARSFRPELDRVSSPEARRQLLAALATVLSWSAWDALRSDSDCTVDEATVITQRTVRALLGRPASPGSSGPASSLR